MYVKVLLCFPVCHMSRDQFDGWSIAANGMFLFPVSCDAAPLPAWPDAGAEDGASFFTSSSSFSSLLSFSWDMSLASLFLLSSSLMKSKANYMHLIKWCISTSVDASRSRVRLLDVKVNESCSLYFSESFLSLKRLKTSLSRPILIYGSTSMSGMKRMAFLFFLVSGMKLDPGSRQLMALSIRKICLGLGLPLRPYLRNVAPF